MSKFFDDAVIFTDIHFGLKNNSKQHNNDCLNFIKWMIVQSHKRNIKKCFFLGDWHHHRATINVSTLNYTVDALQLLNDNFDEVQMIMGNHDLYYREKRDINSLPFANKYPNINIINDEIFEEDGVAFVPWLVDDEWKRLKELKSKFIFGHFELPDFYLNAMIKMPDHGGLKASDLSKADKVFSGHFHKRQDKGNIIYPGNCFPHNYSDAWDDDRGITFLNWNGTYDFETWPDAPKYRVANLSQLLDDAGSILTNNTHCRIILDINISYEEANYIKETFANDYDLREISLMPSKKDNVSGEDWDTDGDISVENVDSIVLSQLEAITSNSIRNETLISIYNDLHI